MISVLGEGTQLCEIALWSIIIYFVCPYIGMPENPKRICQILVILMGILASAQVVLAGTPVRLRPMALDTAPSIIAPERR